MSISFEIPTNPDRARNDAPRRPRPVSPL